SLLACSLLLTGCLPTAATETPAVSTPAPVTLTVEPSPSPAPTASSTPTDTVTELKIWLPPNFAPTEDVPGGELLAQQLAAFEQAHPGHPVHVRLKATSGPGGLLASLSAAY